MDTDKLNKAAQAYCDQHTGGEYTAFIAGAKWANTDTGDTDTAEDSNGDTPITPAQFADRACRIAGYDIERLRVKGAGSKRTDIATARQVIMWGARMATGASYKTCGALVNRDHATAMHACRMIRDGIRMKDRVITEEVCKIKQLITFNI